MKWVTRQRPQVDRVACPWSIQRFVDPHAQLLFAPSDQVRAVSERAKATPFDIPDADLGHRGEECSFDAARCQAGRDKASPAAGAAPNAVRP